MGYPQLPFGMASLPLFGANPLMGANLLAAASAANAQNMQASLGKLHLFKVQNKRVFKASLFVASSTMMTQPTAAAVSSVASAATTSSSAKQPRGRGRGCAREK